MLQVLEIELDAPTHRLEIIAAAIAVEWRPAGEARLDLVADHVTRDESAVLLVDRHRMRARPADTHAAFQNVEQLWQLIEGCGANECADRCDTRVVALRLFVRR